MTTKTQEQAVVISPPNFQTAVFNITGASPYVQLRFGEKAKTTMRDKQKAGQKAKKCRAREARDFDQDYEDALYRADEGWHGIPASSFRNGLISACRTVGFRMTLAKLSVFIEADGLDSKDGTPLARQGAARHGTAGAVRQGAVRPG